MPYYLNQTEILFDESDRLFDVIRAAETLEFGVRIENVRIPQDDGSEASVWVVTRAEEIPGHDEWDGRYVEDDEPEETTE